MRILLVKTSSLGDVVHNLPVASDIRARFTEAYIDWVVEEGFADIPRLHPAVSRVIPVAVRRWRRNLLSAATWRELRAFRAAVRTESYDLVLDTQGLIKSGLMARLARGRHAGYAAEAPTIYEESDGISSLEFVFSPMYHSTFGNWFKASLVNSVATLP